MKQFSVYTLFLLFFLNGCSYKNEIQDVEKFVNARVLPKVQSVIVSDECGFKLEAIKSVAANNELQTQAAYISKKLSKSLAKEVAISEKGNLSLQINSKFKTEQYQVQVSKNGITIEGGGPSGVFYGIQTFLQLLPTEVYANEKISSNYVLPSLNIEDAPRFNYRGMMLDVSRHFIQFDDLLEYVEVLAQQKINVLHLHLTDDQGWRLEIKSHPELTEIGAVRGTGKVLKDYRNRKAPEWQQADSDPYGPFFYTQEQIKELIAYAATRGMTIIPEIDVPGHSLAINKSLNTGCKVAGLEGVHGYKGNVMCAGNEEVFQILDDIFGEVAALFPSEYIHIGGDEVNRKQWLNCNLCNQLMKDKKFKDDAQLQHYFVKRTNEIVTKYGKKPIGWNEILKGGKLPKGTTIMSWIGPKPGIRAAKKGIDVIMAPGKYCYFDMKEAKHKLEPGHWWAGIVNLERVYSFDPYESIPEENKKHIKGISGALWTEYVTPEREQLHYKTFPRLLALAEVGWSQPENRDFSEFMGRLGSHHLKRLDAQGIGYRIPRAKYALEKDSISFTKPYAEAEIYYTLNGEIPTINSEKYSQKIPLKFKDSIKFKTTSPVGKLNKYENIIKEPKKKKKK
ncbi:family 20 glycosylhydrolase [Polaribacter sp.]|uniref:beta-N-acetylhexosaminidase n=1 Tax=Polaribacter sp. TaxID=1920175 RepID=UPI0025E34A96|nr:family 20 glycosylhydrolase [Polaribacter sp.]